MTISRKGGGAVDSASDNVATAVFLIDPATLTSAAGQSGLTPFTTALAAATAVSAKAAAGNLIAASCTNANASVRFLQIHNKATVPVNTDVPVAAWPIPSGSANAPGLVSLSTLDFGERGFACALGVALGISTTLATYTAATAADHVLNGGVV